MGSKKREWEAPRLVVLDGPADTEGGGTVTFQQEITTGAMTMITQVGMTYTVTAAVYSNAQGPS